MNVEIRDYKAEDFESVYSLWLKTGVTDKKRSDSSEMIESTFQRGGKLFILENKGAIIGSTWITNDGRRLYLHHCCVEKKFQNQGYGDLMVKKSLEFANNKLGI